MGKSSAPAQPDFLPTGSAAAWQAAGPPATDQPLGQPSRLQPARPSAHQLADGRQRSLNANPAHWPPAPVQPRQPARQPLDQPSSLTAASAAPPVGRPPWPSPDLPPALAQPSPAQQCRGGKVQMRPKRNSKLNGFERKNKEYCYLNPLY